MNQEDHYAKAERLLEKAELVLTQAYSETTVEKSRAYTRLAEAHMKMIPLAPMSMPKR